MEEVSVLIGGKAGDGIKQAGNLVARLFNELGYWVFVYEDYPSLITGGHNFSIIRASGKRVLCHREKVDVIVAFNGETVAKHRSRSKPETILVYDSDSLVSDYGFGFPMSKIARENNLPLVVRNTVNLGILAGIFGLEFGAVEKMVRESIAKRTEENLKVARVGYEGAVKSGAKMKVEALGNEPKKLFTGNEATGLGAVGAGMKLYIAYPMTPAAGILHFLAASQEELGIVAVHPENEIAVALMAEGAAYAGLRAMVGTSGGGFALMVESLSLAGQAEIPIVFALCQRPGPATGMPTYTAQGDLLFALHAGHGEFPRIVVAPGDSEEAFHLTAEAMNLAWKYQTPAIVLGDKHLSEGTFSSTFSSILDAGGGNGKVAESPKMWSGQGDYKRYLDVEDGISPLAFPGSKGAVVKANSYEHDEYGITTEESEQVRKMVEKRLRKREALLKELTGKKTFVVHGSGDRVLVTWGSTKGAAFEVADRLGLKVVQPLFLEPFPDSGMRKELEKAEKIIDVEINATGQLATLLQQYGIFVDKKILKYDGRPFTLDELEEKTKEALK